jgi:hypothetical protein
VFVSVSVVPLLDDDVGDQVLLAADVVRILGHHQALLDAPVLVDAVHDLLQLDPVAAYLDLVIDSPQKLCSHTTHTAHTVT